MFSDAYQRINDAIRLASSPLNTNTLYAIKQNLYAAKNAVLADKNVADDLRYKAATFINRAIHYTESRGNPMPSPLDSPPISPFQSKPAAYGLIPSGGGGMSMLPPPPSFSVQAREDRVLKDMLLAAKNIVSRGLM